MAKIVNLRHWSLAKRARKMYGYFTHAERLAAMHQWSSICQLHGLKDYTAIEGIELFKLLHKYGQTEEMRMYSKNMVERLEEWLENTK